MQEEAISALTSLGLSQGEAKTYLALASVKTSQATPLSELAGVPQPKVYSYLDSLESKELVIKTTISGKPNLYTAENHEIVFEKLQKQLNSRIDQAKEFIKNQQNDKPSVIDEPVRVTQGHTAVMTSLQSLANEVKNNIYLMNHQHYDDIIERIFRSRSIEIIEPIKFIKQSPFGQLLQSKKMEEVFKDRYIMVILQDVNLTVPSVKSLTIVAFPTQKEDIDPVMIQILHPTILDLQIGVIKSFFEKFAGGLFK